MDGRITMESDAVRADLLPAIGGAIAAFHLKTDERFVPILRPWDGKTENPRAMACSPMVPWFGRLSGGGISFGGRFHPIAPNDPLEPFPLHGDGWQAPWQVAEHASDRVVLTLRSRTIPPFDYEAVQVLRLTDAAFHITLSVTHHGAEPLPYGLGLHPWFVRSPGVTLRAKAKGAWLEQPPDAPETRQPEPVPERWDFSKARGLPDDLIDNGFAGWDGSARIEWTDRGVALDLEADTTTHYYHVFSPDKDCDFFCFEPVTHAVNAFAKPGSAEANDLRVLQPGETTKMHVTLVAALL